MKQIFGILSFLLFFAVSGFAQQSPVKWEGNVKHVKGNQYEVTLVATMQTGWYIYSQYMESGGPVPTKITFFDAGVKPTSIAEEFSDYRKEGFDELFEMEIIKFGKQVKFVQTIEVPEGLESIDGHVMYMSCDDEQCLPPKRQKFNLSLNDVTFSLM
ncbi:MAG: hypothetical protein KTR13_00585 [Saprospiraceae bacterium]|nr:hypothetical protein [Saprospiraceae bacterium]